MWIAYALLSALFASATTLLAKAGVKDADSDIITAVRTAVILIVTAAVVLCEGLFFEIGSLTLRDLLFLIGSGVCTGGSWLCCFRALKLGSVGNVMAVDKTSTLLTMLIGILFFADPINGWKVAGMAMILVGSLAMVAPAGKCGGSMRKGKAYSVSGGVPSVKGSEDDPCREIRVGTERSATEGNAASEQSIVGDNFVNECGTALQTKKRGVGAWLIYAVLSAVFASLQSVLAKLGMTEVSSHTATLVRTAVVLIFAWGIVAARGKLPEVRGIGRKTLLFALLSGVTAGLSWLLYYMAVQTGVLSAVAAIDKLSLPVSVGLAVLLFRERQTKTAVVGLVLLVVGTLLFLL